jgi:hypothetical protein
MQEILKEQGFQQAGCTSDQCAIETGQMLGVKYMVVGSIGLVGHTYTISCRLIDVSTGKMVATAHVDCKCEIDDILSRSTVDLSRKLVQSFSSVQTNASPPSSPLTAETGSLKISSSPSGAALLVNDTAKGNTPANIDSLKPGKYQIALALPGYRNITDNLQVSAGGILEKTYSLNSLTGSRNNNGKKLFPMWSKIALGAATVVVAGTGIGMDRLVDREATSCASISSQYANSGSNASYSSFSQDYANHYNNETKYSLYRNVLYGVAGVLAAGFVVSFLY